MTDDRRTSWIRVLTWVPLSAAIIAAAVIGTNGVMRVKSYAQRTVVVTGSAKKRITSDLGEWESRITTENADWAAGYRDLTTQTGKLVAWLESQGLKKDQIRVGSATRSENIRTEVTGSGETRLERQVRTGWTTTQSITVSAPDVALIERLSREVTGLIDQGIAVESYSPAWFYTKLGDLKIEMLAEAAKDARTRADRMVQAVGGNEDEDAARLQLRNIDMGVINVNPANSTQTTWDGNNDTTSLEKDIITIVHGTFDLK